MRSIGIASLVLAGIATTGVTCSSQLHVSKAMAQRERVEKLTGDINKAQAKVELSKAECDKRKEEAVKAFEAFKISPERLILKRVWIFDSGKTDRCGFFYPKGQGYSVIDPKCEGAIFHEDAHMLYNKIMHYANQNTDASASFYKFLSELIDRNRATSGAVYFYYFSREGRVPAVGPEWGNWAQVHGDESQKIYKELEYLFETGTKKKPAAEFATILLDEKEPKDRALDNAVRIIIGRGFIGTGTGTEMTEIGHDYFGRFVQALDDASQGIDDQKLYKALSKQVKELYKIHAWVKSQGADGLTNIGTKNNASNREIRDDIKKRAGIEKQFMDSRKKVQAALVLLRKGSPKAAEYLENWLNYQVMPGLMDEMFARLGESLIMRHNDSPTMDRFKVDGPQIYGLQQLASHIEKSANEGAYTDKENALAVVRHIRGLVGHYMGGVQEDSKATWESIFKDTKCFDNAENAMVAAEIEEIRRAHQKNLDVVEQLPSKEKFYAGYIAAMLMLAGAGYLVYSGQRKDD